MISFEIIFLEQPVILININVLMFQLYDHDKDGILNFKETQKVLRCLGLRVNEDQVNYFSFSTFIYRVSQKKCSHVVENLSTWEHFFWDTLYYLDVEL